LSKIAENYDHNIDPRLNHPVRTVRNRISELLCRIADEHPQLVIYPAVVGSMSAASSDTFSKLLSSRNGFMNRRFVAETFFWTKFCVDLWTNFYSSYAPKNALTKLAELF
jgi:hypothetical protein